MRQKKDLAWQDQSQPSPGPAADNSSILLIGIFGSLSDAYFRVMIHHRHVALVQLGPNLVQVKLQRVTLAEDLQLG